MKIRPVGAELFHADRRTDMTKLIVAFRSFANVPKNARVLTITLSQQSHQNECARDYLFLHDYLSLHSLLYKGHWALPGNTAAGAWCWPSSAWLRMGSSCTFASSLCVQSCNRVTLNFTYLFYTFQHYTANNCHMCNTISFVTFRLASPTINSHMQLMSIEANKVCKTTDNLYGKVCTLYGKYSFKFAFLKTVHNQKPTHILSYSVGSILYQCMYGCIPV